MQDRTVTPTKPRFPRSRFFSPNPTLSGAGVTGRVNIFKIALARKRAAEQATGQSTHWLVDLAGAAAVLAVLAGWMVV